MVKILNVNYDDLLKLRSEKIKSLEAEEKQLSIKFFNIRKTLKVNLALDDNQLRILISVSNESLDHLSELLNKGKHLLNLANTCHKFETEREKILKWISVPKIEEIMIDSCDPSKEDDVDNKGRKKDDGLTDDEKLYQKALERGFSLRKY